MSYTPADNLRYKAVVAVDPSGSPLGSVDNPLHVLTSPVGGPTTTIDRELVVTTYKALNVFTDANIGDVITATQIIDVSSTPTTINVIWRNQTQAIDLSSAPNIANLELLGSIG